MISYIAALAIGQNPVPTQVVPSVPIFLQAKESKGDISTELHSVTVRLGAQNATFETVTLYRNRSTESAASGSVRIPFFSNGYSPKANGELTAKWMDQPVSGRRIALDLEKKDMPQSAGIVLTQGAYYEYAVTVPARGSASLKTSFEIPLAKVALGQVARQIAYRIEKTDQPVGQFQFAIKYSPKEVFGVIDSLAPFKPFEVGANGAFVKSSGQPLPAGFILFRYYPERQAN